MAEALAGCGDLEQALVTAEEAVAVACRKQTLFWELQAQVALAGVLLHREGIKDRPRIAKALARADELIEKTGGAVMKPHVIKRQADFAKCNGDDAGHQRMLKEAHRLFRAIEAHGYAERLAAKLRDFETSSGA